MLLQPICQDIGSKNILYYGTEGVQTSLHFDACSRKRRFACTWLALPRHDTYIRIRVSRPAGKLVGVRIPEHPYNTWLTCLWSITESIQTLVWIHVWVLRVIFFGVIKHVYMDMACFGLPKNHTFGLELAS